MHKEDPQTPNPYQSPSQNQRAIPKSKSSLRRWVPLAVYGVWFLCAVIGVCVYGAFELAGTSSLFGIHISYPHAYSALQRVGLVAIILGCPVTLFALYFGGWKSRVLCLLPAIYFWYAAGDALLRFGWPYVWDFLFQFV
ncbi:MAG: hypothetical protein COA78_28790 [Blastopirellula sp.]|nr:MAG: hypothetical protein COA78_28790 [Blastopirellula sp.]